MQLFQTILPTLLALVGGGVGWYFRARWEASRKQQEKLRDERASVYMEILDPFIRLFHDLSPQGQKKTLEKIKSLESRRSAFRLVLVGEDDVVRAWNQMWRTLYEIEREGGDNLVTLKSFGNVLLEIRKSIGGSKTELNEPDMLAWLIKDIDSLYSRDKSKVG